LELGLGHAVGSKIFDPAQICRAILFDAGMRLGLGRWMEGTWTSGSALVVVIRVYSDFAFLLAQNIFSQIKPNDQ
jgi:hypothetical protein